MSREVSGDENGDEPREPEFAIAAMHAMNINQKCYHVANDCAGILRTGRWRWAFTESVCGILAITRGLSYRQRPRRPVEFQS